MQENALERLSNILKRDYPDVSLYEISVEQNLEVFESLQVFSEALRENKTSYVRQRFL